MSYQPLAGPMQGAPPQQTMSYPGVAPPPPGQVYGVVVQPAQLMWYTQPPHQWKVGVCEGCVEAPGMWCYALCCPVCAVYEQRKRLLAFTGEPYSCCQTKSLPSAGSCCEEPYTPPPAYAPAIWPPQEGNLPPILRDFNCELCLEATCCTGCAIGGTRNLMHHKFNVQNSDCDTATICCVLICCAMNRNRHARDSGFASLLACLTAQQGVELEMEEAKRVSMPTIGYAAPVQQTMGSPVAESHKFVAQTYQQPPPQQYQQQGHYAQGQQYQQPQYQQQGQPQYQQQGQPQYQQQYAQPPPYGAVPGGPSPPPPHNPNATYQQ